MAWALFFTVADRQTRSGRERPIAIAGLAGDTDGHS
jgi:hypothetical protein